MSASYGDEIAFAGLTWKVTGHPEFDQNLLVIEQIDNSDNVKVIMQEQVEWNYSDIKFAVVDSELMQDYS